MPQWAQKISPVLLQSEFTENPEKPCRIIVEMATPYTDRIASYVEANSGAVHREMRLVPSIVVELPYSAIEYMILSPHIRKIWHDIKVRALLDIAVPTVGGGKSQELGFTGKDVTVAVIDTGIFPHSDLVYPESRIVAWKDLVNERENAYDDNGHGTHVSGIIAGNGASSRGRYTGMAPEAKLVGIKALDREGSGNTSDVITALEWCIQNQETYNIRAINLSLGSAAQESFREDPLCRAVSAAWSRGMVVCIAAGNDGPDPRTINTPGINPNAITVGSLDDQQTVEVDDDLISESSSRGPTIDNSVKPDLLAPGVNITSLRAGGGYRTLSGTSMATPMVTGAVAQMIQKWPSLKPDEIKNRLKRNAREMGLQSNFEGAGGLNLDGLFEESKKESSSQQNPLANILSGISSTLKNLFGQKSTTKDQTDAGSKTGNRNPLAFAMLMLLPLMFI
ncbi:MAG TPA: S8 family peptidase [Bacillota bacterium]|nr:S8 family peptidase [Bacillota bacterium]